MPLKFSLKLFASALHFDVCYDLTVLKLNKHRLPAAIDSGNVYFALFRIIICILYVFSEWIPMFISFDVLIHTISDLVSANNYRCSISRNSNILGECSM